MGKYSGKNVGLLLATALLFFGLTGCSKPITKSAFLLNTFVTVTLYDKPDADVLEGCLDLCESYEAIFSKTREGSEVYRLNHRSPGETEFKVSEDVARIIRSALYYSELSQGAFDITVEPLTTLWDIGSKSPQVPDAQAIVQAVDKVGYQNLKLEGNTLIFLSPDTRIDLGAIAKGYIADRMKEYLLERGIKSALINLGGNVLCVGEKPGRSSFKVRVQKPYADLSEGVATVEIKDRSVVSSGIYERYFIEDGKNYHHILNPATGYPVENQLLGVTILSAQSVDGDGLSTVCFSLGLEQGMDLLNSLDGVYGIFITKDETLHYSEGARAFLPK